MTTQRSTLRTNSAIFFSGSGCVKPSFKKAGLRRGLAGVHEGNAGGDDAELLAAGNDLVQRRGFAPFGHFGQLLPQPAVGRARVGGNQVAPAQIALEMRRGRGQRGGAGRTGACVWQTRVVTRSSTGIFQRSEISMAASVKS